MCDSPSVCSKRKDEFESLIGTILEGLIVDHNPYTGGCQLKKEQETCICSNGNANHPKIPDRCVDVQECVRNPCSGEAYTGQCIERWGSYECVCVPSEAVHPLSRGVVDLRRCVCGFGCSSLTQLLRTATITPLRAPPVRANGKIGSGSPIRAKW